MSKEAMQQALEACPVCDQVHSILDVDESRIIRNAKDGYPGGQSPRVLTLQERVMALCRYAADWKRWCLEKENTPPPQRKPLTLQERTSIVRANKSFQDKDEIDAYGVIDDVEAAHGIKENT